MIKNLYLHLKRRFEKGEKSGVDQDYLRRWSRKSVNDKFIMMQSMWEFGEESKKIHARNRRAAAKKSTKA